MGIENHIITFQIFFDDYEILQPHQLKILKQNKLVKGRREGKSVFYSLADDHVRTIIEQGIDHIAE